MKRFYKDASASASPARLGGYVILLDGKPVKTPRRAMLSVPNLPLAEAIAMEWRRQGEKLDTHAMPLTRLAFAALDVIVHERAHVAEQLLEFARTDLLCYRAEDSPELAARQAAIWNPLLDWAAETYGARLRVGAGIVYVEQPAEAMAELERTIERYDAFELAALHTVTTITGSLILGLALAEEEIGAEEAFAAATLDEAFQAETWGRDTEAEKRSRNLLAQVGVAERFMRLLES